MAHSGHISSAEHTRLGANCTAPSSDRIVLHVDCNCFYASVEMHRRPELRGTAMVVGGDEEARHGIVLAKSPLAKAAGIKTGEVLWEARKKCPGLVVVPPDYKSYIRYSRLARSIYYDYTDRVEPFGLDECWLDITGSVDSFGGSARLVAEEISERIKAELGITVSVGLSWNKIFAKLGSDTDPGDGVVETTRQNFSRTVWPLPVNDLMYVGPATTRKLASAGVRTIGDLAHAGDGMLARRLGKMGAVLKCFASGNDITPVRAMNLASSDVVREIKSIGNGLTAPHDITNSAHARALIYLLAESVSQRLRECRMRTRTIAIGAREAKTLAGYTRQCTLHSATCATRVIARTAWALLCANEPLDETHPLRGLHVRASNLVGMGTPLQIDLFGNEEARLAAERLDFTIDELRARFGNTCIRRLNELADPSLRSIDIKADNVIHPVSYFGE